ncbi:MAG: hypothetical protein O6950_08660 [Gammaproteobacteria bacterium]|nr:hypothetical protein [Gammaproteobacteria bacterium]
MRGPVLMLCALAILFASDSGSAAEPIYSSPEETRRIRAALPVQGRAAIYIYRHHDDAGGPSPAIWLNRYQVGRLLPGTFTALWVSAGRIEIRTEGVQTTRLPLTSEVGNIYLIRVSVIQTAQGPNARLTRVPPDARRNELAAIRLLRNPREIPAALPTAAPAVTPPPPPKPQVAPAPKPKAEPKGAPTFRLGVTAWISDGETSWNHDASALDPRLGNPTSELTYKKVKSNVIEISGRWQGERLYTKAAYGAGDISDGTLVDDDFVSASGAAFFGTSVSGAHRFSRTHSEIDGDGLSYFNLTVGGQIWRTTTRKGHLNIYAGYQKWKEKYVAKGLEQIECTAPGVLCAPAGFVGFTGQRVITNEVEWESIFVGVNGTIQVSRRVALSGDIAYTQKAKMHNEDIHHLRTDLRKDPSFEMSGDGDGWNVEAKVTIKIIKNLSAYVGFRYWKLEVQDGKWTVFPITGSPVNAKLNELSSERKGLILGISNEW